MSIQRSLPRRCLDLSGEQIPVIKERRIQYIIYSLKCFHDNPFNRELQRACVLKLYPDKNEHSVFRGVTIHTLRKLGLIVGRGDRIRLGSNGKIILDSDKVSMRERTIRAVILEIDFHRSHFIELIKKAQPLKYSDLISYLQKDAILGKKQLKERVDSWVRILTDSGLVDSDREGRLTVKSENLETAMKDLRVEEKEPSFIEILLSCFSALHKYGTAGMIDIADLRSEVSIEYLHKRNMILTEAQFDQLLRNAPKVTDTYIITFGQPMGAEEQLFIYRGNYYRTINIRMLKER